MLVRDKRPYAEMMREIDARAGIDHEPDVTAEELVARLRQMQRDAGVRPEDNLGSREIMRMRYGDEWDKE